MIVFGSKSQVQLWVLAQQWYSQTALCQPFSRPSFQTNQSGTITYHTSADSWMTYLAFGMDRTFVSLSSCRQSTHGVGQGDGKSNSLWLFNADTFPTAEVFNQSDPRGCKVGWDSSMMHALKFAVRNRLPNSIVLALTYIEDCSYCCFS